MRMRANLSEHPPFLTMAGQEPAIQNRAERFIRRADARPLGGRVSARPW